MHVDPAESPSAARSPHFSRLRSSLVTFIAQADPLTPVDSVSALLVPVSVGSSVSSGLSSHSSA